MLMIIVFHTLENIKAIFLVVLLINLSVIDNKFSKNVVLYRGKVKEYGYCRKVMKKRFNKNLVMTAE